MSQEKEFNISSEDMIDLYINEEKSLSEIARIAGCNLETVRQRLLKRNVELRGKGKYTLPISKNKLIKMNTEKGMSVTEIADMIGCTPSTIRFHLKNAGVNIVLDDRYNLSISKEEIISLYEEGLTGQEIADIAGCTVTNIYTHLENEGIERTGRFRKYEIEDKRFFQHIDTEEKAYILGLLYADGCNETDNYRITLQLKYSDIKLVEQIRDIIYGSDERPIYIKKKKGYENGAALVISSKIMSYDLAEKGVVKNKSLILQYPDFYLGDLERHMIRGIFDGDGWITSKNRWGICGNYGFVYSLQDRLYQLAGIEKKKIQQRKNVAKIEHGSKKDIELFFDLIYTGATIYLERKYEKFIETFQEWEYS